MNAKKILLPTDFSRHAGAALEIATLLARQLDAQLLVAHVMPAAILPGPEDDVYDPREATEHAMLEHVQPTTREVDCQHRFLRGNPPDEILKLAEKDNVDLIVMGTHGHTDSDEPVTGAIAQAILKRATCPVVAVKEPARAKREGHSSQQDERARHTTGVS